MFQAIRSQEERAEGPVTRTMEKTADKMPTDTFLLLAGGSILGSLTLMMLGRRHQSLFVGQWAPTFLVLGLYNKIMKFARSGR